MPVVRMMVCWCEGDGVLVVRVRCTSSEGDGVPVVRVMVCW